MVAEGSRTLMRALRIDGEPCEPHALEEDVFRAQGAGLSDALAALPLIGGRPALRLRLVNEKHSAAIVAALERSFRVGSGDLNPLIIETPKLRKGSKLKDAIAALERGMVLEFQPDTPAETTERVARQLREQGVTIEPEALRLFTADLPGHRGLANQEVEKLALFARGLSCAVTLSDIAALSAVDTETAIHAYTDAVFAGEAGGAHAALERLLVAGTSPISLLRALHREAERLLGLQAGLARGLSEAEAGRQVAPPVFDWAWPALRPRLQRWPTAHLVRLLARLGEAEAGAKSAGALSHALISEMTTALTAAR